MDLWMLLGLGGAISSLVFGWDRGFGALSQQLMGETNADSTPTDPQSEELPPEGPQYLDSLIDFGGTSGDDEVYVTAVDERADDWEYDERTDLEHLLTGEDQMAWFYTGEDHSDPEAGHNTGADCEDILYIDTGAGNDLIEVWGHAATEVVTGTGADTVKVCADAGYTVVHVEDDDTAILCDDWTGYVIGTGSASVYGGDGVDVIRMTGDSTGSNVQAGGGDDDLITGGGGILNGNEGSDTLVANGDNAILRGGTGDDTITSHGANTVIGGEGDDTLVLGHGFVSRTYSGDDGGFDSYTRIDDVALGGNGAADTVHGDAGADIISYIDGGDVVTGGGGVDTFTAIADDEASVITDFHPGKETLTLYETGGTMITHGSGTLTGELDQSELDALMQGDESYHLDGRISVDYDQDANETTIRIDGDAAVVLQNTSWVTVGYTNGGDDTVYGLDGAPLAEGLRANVLVSVHPNITQISQLFG
ncbi:hypothetical protein HJ526_00230 [Donghicola sp. C2-DW-16]|uniref:Calcium-binding protein n=1 Tax=Donghicola mangrovi TaxID=2729614 RepID=A0ABX2P8P2_9RHOB|nr:hypothetical protein [Donghicola mangrovi]NVO25830.1 hypothetical protein [Donghicola mangrovi]